MQEELDRDEILTALQRNFDILSLDAGKVHLRRPLDAGHETVKIHVIMDDLNKVVKTRHLILENFRFSGEGVLSNFHQELDILQLNNCVNLLAALRDMFAFTDIVEGKTRIKSLIIQDEHYHNHFGFFEQLVEFVKAVPQLTSVEVNGEDFSDRSKFVKMLATGQECNQIVNRKITLCHLLEERRA